MKAKTITIFGSSHPQEGMPEYENALMLGADLARHGWSVCNGGYGGTMEASAKGARSSGGHTIGVTCRLFDREANAWIKEEILTATLEERLKTLVARGDGFAVLPGGTGTLLELSYVLELMNKEFLPVRPVVLYGPFWGPVLEPLRKEMKDDRLERFGKFLFHTATSAEAAQVFQNLRSTSSA